MWSFWIYDTLPSQRLLYFPLAIACCCCCCCCLFSDFYKLILWSLFSLSCVAPEVSAQFTWWSTYKTWEFKFIGNFQTSHIVIILWKWGFLESSKPILFPSIGYLFARLHGSHSSKAVDFFFFFSKFIAW